MDKFFFRRQKPTTRHPLRAFASLQIFHGVLHWFAELIRFTEEEQKDAGICIGDQRYR